MKAARQAWRVGAAVGGLTILATVGVATARVDHLEAHEVRWLEPTRLADATPLADGDGVTLATVPLERDHVVAFQVCAEDPMLPARWRDAMSLAVVRPASGEVMTESPLSEQVLARVERDARAGCLTLGRGTIAVSDEYAVQARWREAPAALREVPLVVRVLGRHPLGPLDLGLVLGAWLGGLLLVLSFALRSASPGGALPSQDASQGADAALDARGEWEAAQARASPLAKVPDEALALLGVGLLAGLFWLLGHVSVDAAGGTALMFSIAALELAVAVALARGPGLGPRLERLGLRRPRHWLAWLPAAVAAGFALWFLARLATRLVPSTGVSSVELLVSWPSGLLSFAVPAVLVPIAEEVFFRGFVFGALERRSRALAFAGAWLLFVGAHVPQTFGQWGALVAISVAGLGFTALRALSRSTLVSALAHLVYNGVLALGAVL